MLPSYLELTVMFALFLGGITAVLNYLGGSTLYLIIRLSLQGSIKIRGLSWSPHLQARKVSLVQPARLGGHTIFTCDTVVTDASLWQIVTGHNFEVVVSNPWLDWAGTEEGDSHLVTLLKDVGYIREVGAKKEPLRANKDAVGEGPNGEKGSKGTAVETVNVKWNGEVRAFTVRLLLRDGIMQMSKDLGIVMGENVRFKALVGLTSLAADEKATESNSYKGHWFARDKWPAPTEDTGCPKYPLAMAAASDKMVFELAGWRTTTGLLLRKPILSALQLTPTVANFALSKLSPLLHCAVGLEEGDSITVHMQPAAMHLPASCYHVTLQPMKLVVATRGMLQGIIALLNQRPNVKPTRLEAWTTALRADIYKDGVVDSKRLDIIIGPDARNGKGIQMCCWGRVDPARGNAVDATIGVPSSSLAPLGLQDLPEDFVFAIPVRGSSQQPEFDLARAGKRLGEMLVKHRVSQGLPFMRGFFQQQEQKRKTGQTDEEPAAPPALRPFPWEKEIR
ncbi:g1148 [Coccomyxa elongata]